MSDDVHAEHVHERFAAHPLDREIGEDHQRFPFLRSLQRFLPFVDDFGRVSIALQHECDESRYLRVVFHDENHGILNIGSGPASVCADARGVRR